MFAENVLCDPARSDLCTTYNRNTTFGKVSSRKL